MKAGPVGLQVEGEDQGPPPHAPALPIGLGDGLVHERERRRPVEEARVPGAPEAIPGEDAVGLGVLPARPVLDVPDRELLRLRASGGREDELLVPVELGPERAAGGVELAKEPRGPFEVLAGRDDSGGAVVLRDLLPLEADEERVGPDEVEEDF